MYINTKHSAGSDFGRGTIDQYFHVGVPTVVFVFWVYNRAIELDQSTILIFMDGC